MSIVDTLSTDGCGTLQAGDLVPSKAGQEEETLGTTVTGRVEFGDVVRYLGSGPGRVVKRWVKSESTEKASRIPSLSITTKLVQSTKL